MSDETKPEALTEEQRESLGRLVREEWVAWAREQDAPKPSWLVPWEGLAEPDREVDRRIGERLLAAGRAAGAEEALTGLHESVMGPSKDLRDVGTCLSIANDITDHLAALRAESGDPR